jgi:histidinol-phosphate/aromatic aminotransferase/cobyric acid decarboxylase-like protein
MRVIVIGAGPIGLFSGMALARRGHDVTIVDRDGGPDETGQWERKGVMQFHLPHFSHFVTEGTPETAAGLVTEFPELIVVNSLSKNYGIAGLRLGYAVMSAQRAKALRDRSLWNLNALAEWFTGLLCDGEFQRAYESSRCRYVRDTRTLFSELDTLPGARAYPSAANFALLELDRTAAEVTSALLARHGVYVRDCTDKRGLEGGHRYIRVAARSQHENRRIIEALRDVLCERALIA